MNTLHACPGCGTGMPDLYRFCGLCGTPLAPPCPACGGVLPPGFRFCGYCGASLPRGGEARPEPPQRPAAVSLPTPAPTARVPESRGEERRRVAILFADLSGSTALADRLDAEASYRAVSDCLRGLGEIVTAAGGYVVKNLGDGLMALFGAPAAHGDDPVRAGRAGLRMQEWMQEYAREVEARYGATLRLRVGINYGSVVAAPLAAGDRPEYDVLGDAVNVAQRLEAAAEPGTVCVSEPFYRIARPYFHFEDRGTARVKGKPEPLQLYRLTAEREGEGGGEGLPLVGREPELRTLHEAARALGEERRGGLLALVGAGGMGKSRLLEELAAELAARGIAVLRGAGREGGAETPLALWRSWLLELLPVHPRMTQAEAAVAIQEALPDPSQAAWADWLAALAVAPAHLLALEPDARERTTRAALGAFLAWWQQDRPLALIVDEAGLLDSLSLRLVEEAARLPGRLVALAGRETASYPPPGAETIVLGPLAAGAAEALVAAALPGVALPEGLGGRVAERTGGSPLFLDVTLRAARTAEDPVAALEAVPDSLYGLLRAQLDRLPTTQRTVAEWSSVLGKRFAEEWLAARCRDELPGERPWRPLEEREWLQEQRPEPHRELAFRHGALQEVLYEGMLADRRRAEHRRAAELLAPLAERQPELAGQVARHWRAADEAEPALAWSLRAAEHAFSLYAGEEAEALYRQCLELAERLHAPEAALRAASGLAELLAHRGDFPAALELYRSAEEAHGAAAGADPACRQRLAVLRLGHARTLGRTGSLAAAAPLLEQAQPVLAEDPSPDGRRNLVRCRIEAAHLYCDLGRVEEARAAASEALELAEAEEWTAEASAAGSALGIALQAAGEGEASERELRRAARRAEQAGDWQGAAACWCNLGLGLQSSGQLGDAARVFSRALEQAQRIGDAEKIAILRMNLGTVRLNRGEWREAEAELRAAQDRFREMEHPLGLAACLCNLADTLRWAGDPGAARDALAEAQRLVEGVDCASLQVHLQLAAAELALGGGDPETGGRLAREALALAEETGYETGAALCRHTLGRVLRAAGDLEAAERELSAAMEALNGAEPLEGARIRAELAAVYAATGREAEARSRRDAAVSTLRRLDALPWLEKLAA